MRFSRWTNPHLPQTLQIAIFLLYADVIFGLLLGTIVFIFGLLIGVAYLVACALAGLGIANEMKWGWTLGVVASAVGLAPYALLIFGVFDSLRASPRLVIGFMFAAAQLALLLHPQSRDHQRIWFS